MKVNIGPYVRDLVPVRRLENWYNTLRTGLRFDGPEPMTWYDKVVYWFLDKLDDVCIPINRWWRDVRERRIKVHIDDYDVWNADHTLALIILPTLKRFKQEQQGYFTIDKEDRIEGEEDEVAYNRVIDHIIWSFEQLLDDNGDDEFYHNRDQLTISFEKTDECQKYSQMKLDHQKDPSKPAYYVDREGLKAYNKKIQDGLILFGKYYRGLWT